MRLRREPDGRVVLTVRLSRWNALAGGILAWGGSVGASHAGMGDLSALLLVASFAGAWYGSPWAARSASR